MNKHFDVKLNGNIIQTRLLGYWEIDSAERYLAEIRRLLIPLQGKSWCSVNNLLYWQGGTEEAIALIIAERKRLVAAGAKCSSYVVQANSPILDALSQNSPAISGYVRKLFVQEEDAYEWLASQGFNLETKD